MPQSFEAEFHRTSVAHESRFPRFGISRPFARDAAFNLRDVQADLCGATRTERGFELAAAPSRPKSMICKSKSS